MPSGERSLVVESPPALVGAPGPRPAGHAHLGVPRSGALDRPRAPAGQPPGGQPRGRGDAGDASAGGCGCAWAPDARWRSPGAQLAVVVDGRRPATGRRGRRAAGRCRARLGPRCVGAAGLPGRGGWDRGGTRAGVALHRHSRLGGPPPVRGGRRAPGRAPRWPGAARRGRRYRPRRAAARCGSSRAPGRLVRRGAVAALRGSTYVVGSDIQPDRAAPRGSAREAARDDELPSEGMVLGAVQVPPAGSRWSSSPTTPRPAATPWWASSTRRRRPCAQLHPATRSVLRTS